MKVRAFSGSLSNEMDLSLLQEHSSMMHMHIVVEKAEHLASRLSTVGL